MAIPKNVSSFIAERKEAELKYNTQNRSGAKDWVKKGAYIIPIIPGHKKPYIPWIQAVNTIEGVDRLWDSFRDALIGIHTQNSHIFVLDFDQKNGGLESYKRLCEAIPELLETYTEETRNKGIHVILKDDGLKIKTGAHVFDALGFPGIDIRAYGGIVVVAPSIDDTGTYSARKDLPFSSIPKKLYDMLDQVCYIDKPELYESRPAPTIIAPINEEMYPSCIKEMLRVVRLGTDHDRQREHGLNHNERVALASYLKCIGMGKEDIINVFSTVPDFDRKTTSYQVEWLFKQNYNCPKCTTMQAWGVCREDNCVIGSPLYNYIDKIEQAMADEWENLFTLADAFKDRPPIKYALEGIIPVPSLIVPYGAPGSLKSFLLADAAICIAAGIDWLIPMQIDGEETETPIKVTQMPVMWIDFDNGERKTHDRFKMIAKAHDVNPDNIPFYYYSMPDPTLDASKDRDMKYLEQRIKRLKIGLLIVDNLATVSGDNDENSAAMKQVMFRFRKLSDSCMLAIAVIHHERKDIKGSNARVGENLRGHSSIEGAVDLALHVFRPTVDATDITIKSTKTRGADVKPITARFWYEKDPVTGESDRAGFYRVPLDQQAVSRQQNGNGKTAEQSDNNIRVIENTIIKYLRQQDEIHKSPVQKDVIENVQEMLAGNDMINKGEKAIDSVLKKMLNEGLLDCIKGGRNGKFWSLKNVPDELNISEKDIRGVGDLI
jgi:hypothetical protein